MSGEQSPPGRARRGAGRTSISSSQPPWDFQLKTAGGTLAETACRGGPMLPPWGGGNPPPGGGPPPRPPHRAAPLSPSHHPQELADHAPQHLAHFGELGGDQTKDGDAGIGDE